MITRKEHLSTYPGGGTVAEQNAHHRAYYAQFITPQTITSVVRVIGADRLRKSRDPHLNDIPLVLWDRLAPALPGSGKFEDADDFYTLGGAVCLAKEAARQWLESQP